MRPAERPIEPKADHGHLCPTCGREDRVVTRRGSASPVSAADGGARRVASVAARRCGPCRGTGRKGHPDCTIGFTFACPTCDGTGFEGEGYATAAELAALQDAAIAAGADAEALRRLSLTQFGEVPDRLRERHVTGLVLALAARSARRGRLGDA